ncbi:MAG: PAS domain S-box protein, partial [Mariprofundaceae bacterium]|nr:PAS domain S-box protein [Mariprofundaceae bacterium]
SPNVLAVREDSGIRSFLELSGHHLALNNGRAQGEILAALKLSGAKLDEMKLEKNDANAIESLQRGTIEGLEIYLSHEPYRLKRMGVPYRILNPRDAGVDFYNDFLLTSNHEVHRYPQIVHAFVKATKKGWQDALLHPEQAIALIQKKYNTQHLSADELRYEAKVLIPLLAWDSVDVGYISNHRLNLMMNTFVRLSWLKMPHDMSGFVYDASHLSEQNIWLKTHAWQLLGGILSVLLLLAGLTLLYVRKVLHDKTADLQVSEAMWRHFVDIADVGIFIHRHGKMLFANDYMLERMELTADAVVGIEVASYIHPDDILLASERVKKVMEDNAVIRSASVRYISPSGRLFDAEVSSLRIMFEGDFAVLTVARDVTERKQHEAALQASEAQYRHLVERSPNAVMVHQAGKLCFSNPAGIALFGAESMDDLMGRSVMTCVHPDYHNIVLKRMKKELDDGEVVPLIEERLIRLDGSEFWAEVTGIPIQYEGAAAGLLIARDITDKKQAEMQLRQEKRKMQTILEYAPIGIWMLDMDGSVQLVNKAFTNILGISEQAFMAADTYTDLLPDDVAVRCNASNQACIQQKHRVMLQEPIPCADGKVHIFDMIKAPFFDDDGVMQGIVGLAIDATQRMEAEAEKDRMARQIEHTQRLESLGVLAGGVAHDFNNILAVILGNASLMKRKLASDTNEARQLQRIIEASEKARLLCCQMLAYSGQGQIEIHALNLTKLSQSIVSLLEVSLGENVTLAYDLDTSLPSIDADEAQMQQVVMNLVINASEAMGDEGGHIELKTYVRHILPEDLQVSVGEPDVRLSEVYVCLEVSDNGCGMSDEVKQRIFEPFYTTKFTGRGLGMSAILGIVRAHQGCLSLYTQQGIGTKFRLFFPLGQLTLKETVGAVSTTSRASDQRSVVLLIDDDE